MGLRAFMGSLTLLRFPEVRRELGEMRFRRLLEDEIRQEFLHARIEGGILWKGYTPGRLSLGSGAMVCTGSVLAFGDDRNGYGRIGIGPNTWVGQYNNLRASANADITIGRDCLVSQFCTIVAANHGKGASRAIIEQPLDESRRGVVLEDGVWLGAGVVVTPGVRLGEGSIIGANAVVTTDVPPFEIWAGVPARRIGSRLE